MGRWNFDYFQLYLRALGLSHASNNRFVRALLIAYGCAIVLSQLYQIKKLQCWDMPGDKSTAIRIYNVVAFYVYKGVLVFMVVSGMLHSKLELKLAALIATIDDDFQLRLYQPPRTAQQGSRLSRLLSLRVINHLVELMWNLTAIVFFVFLGIGNMVTFLREVHTVQAIRVRYLQYSMLVTQIDDELQALQRAIERNLIGTDIKGNDAVFITIDWAKPLQLQQQKQHLQQRGPRTFATVGETDSEVDSEEEDEKEAPMYAPMDDRTDTEQRHLLRRICVMKCIYWKITLILRNMEQLFGTSIVLIDFLCICDFTIVCYFCTLAVEGMPLSWSVLVQSLMSIVSAILKMVTMGVMCDRCSRRGQRILTLLNASKYKNRKTINLLLDDFTLQIMHSPVVFTARRFYTFNLKTLASIFALVMQFLVILLQFAALTNLY